MFQQKLQKGHNPLKDWKKLWEGARQNQNIK